MSRSLSSSVRVVGGVDVMGEFLSVFFNKTNISLSHALVEAMGLEVRG